jgi:hypothetical protein
VNPAFLLARINPLNHLKQVQCQVGRLHHKRTEAIVLPTSCCQSPLFWKFWFSDEGVTYPNLRAYLAAKQAKADRPVKPEKLRDEQIEALSIAGICPRCLINRNLCECR